MNYFKRFSAGLALALLFTVMIYAQEESGQKLQKFNDFMRLNEIWLDEIMDYYNIPGAAIGIVQDQELVYAKGFGAEDIETKEPVTANTVFRIASISKTFTGTAIMQLRDKGLLDLDDPVRKYLPWFELKNPYPGTPEVTIRGIMTHTSGLPREAGFPYWEEDVFPTMDEIKTKLPEQSMIYPPGTMWKYSNLGIALLGEIIAKISGVTYEKYFEDNLLKPLGMNSTQVQIKENDPSLAIGYLYDKTQKKLERAPFTDSKGITAAANLATNISDMAKYISLQFREDDNSADAVLKGSTLLEMHRVHWLQPSWKSGWGLSFGVSADDGITFIGHGGWVGGYLTQIYFVPEHKVGIIVFLNSENYAPSIIAKTIYKNAAILLKKQKDSGSYDYSADWEKLCGRYWDSSFWITNVMIIDKKLWLYDESVPPADDPSDSITELIPVEKDIFNMTGKNGNGETARFIRDEEGNISRLYVGENYLTPIK